MFMCHPILLGPLTVHVSLHFVWTPKCQCVIKLFLCIWTSMCHPIVFCPLNAHVSPNFSWAPKCPCVTPFWMMDSNLYAGWSQLESKKGPMGVQKRVRGGTSAVGGPKSSTCCWSLLILNHFYSIQIFFWVSSKYELFRRFSVKVRYAS